MLESRRSFKWTLAFVLACGLFWFVDGSGGPQWAGASDAAHPTAEVEQDFRNPPVAVKPWAYWWWLKGNVTERSITRDLEEMSRKGIAGLLMFDARGYHEDHVPPPPSKMEFMSPEWRRMLKFAMSEANRLGLKMSVNLSSCAGALKGPWLVGNDAPKKLIWTSCRVQGPKRVSCQLRREQVAHFWNVAVLAVRHAEQAGAKKAPSKNDVAETLNLSGNWQGIQSRPDPKLSVDRVVDLSKEVNAKGQLTWHAPAGSWTILRFACMTMEGHEYDVDVLDPKAVEGHFERMGRALLNDAGPLAGKTLTHFYSVSWEGAAPTWTLAFEEQFRKYRGYRPRSFLPVLAGMTVTDRETSERFSRDYYKTLGDCFRDNFYGKLRELCRREGLKWHSESGGPWNRKLPAFKNADQMAFLGRNDMPQGEFWHLGRDMNRPPAMTAHIYGRPLAATEAFTHMRTHWSAYPAALKPDADGAFCDGINHFIWHTFSASPAEFGKPGIEYFAGTHLNPNVTWWEQSGDFLTYLARCQFLLRQGRFVADVCCYTGDKPYLHWGRGEKWSESASMVLGKGYTYDLVNTEVLLSRLSVENGDLVLPDGMRYRVLAVDLEDETVPPQALRKIAELAEAGATIVLGSRQPTRAPGLRDYPKCDEEIRLLAVKLWGATNSVARPERSDGRAPRAGRSQPRPSPAQGVPPSPQRRSLGRGTIISGTKIDDALQAKGIVRDFEGPCDYIHRRAGETDVYFVAGSGQAECTFRAGGREPELWCPQTGGIRDAIWYRTTDDGRTVVPISLPENGSVFVVFRKPPKPVHLVSVTAPENSLDIAGRSSSGVRLRLWRNSRYAFQTSKKKQVNIDVANLPKPMTLPGPWTVCFAKGGGAPESVAFDKLIPWNEHPQEGIRYFSGTGCYHTTFRLDDKQAGDLVRLELGQVGNVAEVRVNGHSLGVVWTAPWTADLTGLVKPGSNELEIDVTNLWVNRLVGDTHLPAEKRFTKSNVRLFGTAEKIRRFQGFTPETPLEPSGLIGPVRLQFGTQRELPEN